MSGGHFNYDQYRISQIADQIEHIIVSNDDTTLNEWGDPKGRGYSLETIELFREAVRMLNVSFVYAQRVDWLVSGDDDEDSFHKRLGDELENLK